MIDCTRNVIDIDQEEEGGPIVHFIVAHQKVLAEISMIKKYFKCRHNENDETGMKALNQCHMHACTCKRAGKV